MSQVKSVVVRIPRNGKMVEYRVSQEFLAATVENIIIEASSEAMSSFSEEYIDGILDCVNEIYNSYPDVKQRDPAVPILPPLSTGKVCKQK